MNEHTKAIAANIFNGNRKDAAAAILASHRPITAALRVVTCLAEGYGYDYRTAITTVDNLLTGATLTDG